MKSKKKYVIMGSAVLLAIFIMGSGFLAMEGPSGFCGKGFHRGFHGRDFPKHILERLDGKVEELNLSESQQVEYEEIRDKIAADMSNMMENRKNFFTELKEEMDQENPDIEKIAAVLKEKLEQMPLKIGAHLDHFVEFYNILDEDQKGRMIERFREKMNRCPLNRFTNDIDDEYEEK